MFLNFIKNFVIKRKLNKANNLSENFDFSKPVKTIGLLIDITTFSKVTEIIASVLSHGFVEKNIAVLLYKDKINKTEQFELAYFSNNDVSWLGEFKKDEIKNFINFEFDLLISYYKRSKPSLLLVTHQSQSNFKVGFSSIDEKYNQLIIDTDMDQNKIFMEELFKYLKILNKL